MNDFVANLLFDNKGGDSCFFPTIVPMVNDYLSSKPLYSFVFPTHP